MEINTAFLSLRSQFKNCKDQEWDKLLRVMYPGKLDT